MRFLPLVFWSACLVLPKLTLGAPEHLSRHAELASRASGTIAGLARQLSPGASISYNISSAPRWSEFGAPQPGALVNVATERDVQTTVQYCLKNKIPFLAQTGTHGWQNKFDLHQNGVVINMRGLNQVTFNKDRTRATVQGGALVKEVIDSAYASDAQLLTGNCNCVGVLGAGLGGGYGNLMGMLGYSIDNYLSLNVVLADGSTAIVTANDEDLWWALRGAGPNFGIVTSVVMKSKPVPKGQSLAWTGIVFWSEDKLERLIQAIQELHLKPKMVIFLYLITSGAPNYTPSIATSIFYYGTEAEGRKEFKSIFDIGPSLDLMSILPYNQWNTGGDAFCTKGGYKPSYGVGHNKMDPKAWTQVWQAYKDWVKLPGTGNSAVLAECYSHDIPDRKPASSFANRDVKFNSVIIPWYYDRAQEKNATRFGSRARDVLRASDGFEQNRTYINFANGDETNQVIYQDALPRLQRLKKRYDPGNVFRHWFPIQV